MAAFGRAGDYLRFYEINPQVQAVATSWFTYLPKCPGKVEVAPGDARLSLEREPPQHFDLLVLDAFSSDAIPVHLLTKEAFEVYERHLNTNGIIAVHISNHYLDLEPVVVNLARHFGYKLASIDYEETDEEWWLYASTWVLLSRSEQIINCPAIRNAASIVNTNCRQSPPLDRRLRQPVPDPPLSERLRWNSQRAGRLFSPPPLPQSIDRDLAGLDPLRLRQSEGQDSLVHLRGDLGRVDGRVEFEHPPVIRQGAFAEQRLARHRLVLAVAHDGDFIPFQRDFQALLVHARHLRFEHIAVLGLEDVHFRRNVILAPAGRPWPVAVRFELLLSYVSSFL